MSFHSSWLTVSEGTAVHHRFLTIPLTRHRNFELKTDFDVRPGVKSGGQEASVSPVLTLLSSHAIYARAPALVGFF